MGTTSPTGMTPIALKPATYARHAAAVEYVEQVCRTRQPLPGTGRWPGLAPGAWGKLAASGTITAGSGTTLGTGTVTLVDKTGAALASPAETVTVVNSGAAVAGGAGGKLVRLSWVRGDWCVSCGGA